MQSASELKENNMRNPHPALASVIADLCATFSDPPPALDNLRSGGYIREAKMLARAHALLDEIRSRESVRSSTRSKIDDLIDDMEAGE
jgi:hypothetical protein